MLLNVQDAIEVLINVIKSSERNQLYQIESEVYEEEGIAELIENASFNESEKKEIIDKQANKIHFPCGLGYSDNERLAFLPRHKVEEEISDFYEILKKNIEKENESNEKISLFKMSRQIVETSIFFLVILGLEYLVSGQSLGFNIDFFFLFAVVVAVIYGMSYAMYATALSTVGYLVLFMMGFKDIETATTYQILVQTLQLALCAVVIGVSRDNYTRKNIDLEEANQHNLQQLEDITRINESNIYIKEIYGKRLTAYKNSFARLYTITSQLNFLDASKVLCQTAKVVSELIETEHVSIYI